MTVNEEMTNCEDYRKTVTAEPSYDGGGEHLASCSACREWRGELRVLDQQIERALALPVPDLAIPELPDIDAGNVTALPGRQRRAPVWLAMAATVTLAAFVGFRMLGSDVGGLPLAEQILEHLDHEPYALAVTDRPVSDERLARIVPANIATMDHSAGLITYAQSCVINGTRVPHLVIQGRQGPVTILLMPDQPVEGAQSISGESINGVIIPVGDGSIAIIGEDGENLESVEEQVLDSVTFST